MDEALNFFINRVVLQTTKNVFGRNQTGQICPVFEGGFASDLGRPSQNGQI